MIRRLLILVGLIIPEPVCPWTAMKRMIVREELKHGEIR